MSVCVTVADSGFTNGGKDEAPSSSAVSARIEAPQARRGGAAWGGGVPSPLEERCPSP